MTNEHYLIVSYFVVALVSLGLGVAADRALRGPFAVICQAVTGKSRLSTWKRTLTLSMTMAAALGFLSVSYRGCGKSYAEVVKDRSYLVQMNREQLRAASHWIVYAVFAWCLVVVICLVVVLRREKGPVVNE
jgi:hypothetical protein